MTTIQFTNTNQWLVRSDDLTYIDTSKQEERAMKRQALQIVGKDCLGLIRRASVKTLDVVDELTRAYNQL